MLNGGDVPVDAGDADAVVPARTDRPGDVRPIPALVARIPVFADEVPAADVVDVAVPVVVDAVDILRRVQPDVRDEVWVRKRDPGVDDRHPDGVAPPRVVPGVGGGDLGQTPELGEAWVVRDAPCGLANVVGDGVHDPRLAPTARRQSTRRFGWLTLCC
jgi:hypothetical protein